MNNIITDRLLLRPANLEDAAFFLKLLNQESYIKGIRDCGVRDLDSAQAFIQNSVFNLYEKYKLGLYIVLNRHTNEYIGIAGYVKRDFLQNFDIGYALLDEQTGKAYAFEAANALIQNAKTQLQWSKLAAICNPDNISSNQLLKKLGFVLLKQESFPGMGEVSNYYELDL